MKKIASIITANDEICWRGRANGKLKKTLWIWVIPGLNMRRHFEPKKSTDWREIPISYFFLDICPFWVAISCRRV